MADVGKVKAEENKDKENEERSESESETEDTEKDKKGDKNKKKNAASAPASKIKAPAKKRVKAEQADDNKKEKDAKKKKPAPKVKEEEEDEEEEEADGEGDDEGSEGEENGVPDKVPLLDQPLEMSGSRERKQVQRFIAKEESKSDADKKVDIPDGKGQPLGEIPRIQFQINKLKSDNLKILHRVLFNRVGQTRSIKKNIQMFKGFDFDKDSSEYKKKLNVITKVKNAGLKTLCTILDLPKTGKHADLAEKILNFLLLPEDSGKEAPDPRPKRKGISSKSYKEKADDSESKKGKSKSSPSKKKSKDSSDEEDQEEEEEEEEESDEKKTEDENEEENETAGSEEDKPKKATKRAPPKKAATNAASGKKGNSSSGTGSNKKNKEVKSESENENQSELEDDKEPLAKKSKTPPTDDEIKSYVKSVLEGANLEEITMKTVCKKVYEHYPDFDLGYKKDFIKNTVKSLIS